ncbi:hypothetical protein CANINC_000311 [Pichia inconspicua]|uniref:UDP-N-acetylglucosamine transferase subunit ALG13 n=1 Tax=Pichia inconspicua TaxID=52247 RepID=A0A4T0X7K2_9ASCO|nr:hypothetical protein CANINC_000311 [[Candida] inconspicua]
MDTLRSWERDDDDDDNDDTNGDNIVVDRRLIAVPNESLLDNHQLEVANAFASLGALRVVSVPPPTESLAKALTTSLAEPWTTTPLPKAAGAVVGRVIREELARI